MNKTRHMKMRGKLRPLTTSPHMIGPTSEKCEPNNAALIVYAWVTTELDTAQSI
jgi:hypothetical protein